jgi:hypothetical protein
MNSRVMSALAASGLGLVMTAGVLADQSPVPAPVPPTVARTADGKPDLSGVWQALNTAAWDLEDHNAREGVPAGQGLVVGGRIPYQESARAKKQANFEKRSSLDPENNCYLPGIPRLMFMPFPFQIVQTPDEVITLHEYARAIRHIYTNGTEHPRGPIEWWLGDSRGRWEGDTLVVDTVHFTNQTWLDRAGNFHSENLHVVERFTPDGPDHLNYRATLEDPDVYTRPWDIETVLYRRKDKNVQVLEYNCYGFRHEAIYP